MKDETKKWLDSTREKVLKYSLKGVAEFLKSYKPLEYVYEGDFQAELCVSIKNKLKNLKLNYDGEEWFISKDCPKTKTPCLVHCEQWCYKHNDNGGSKPDIAVWDPAKENANKHYTQKDLLLLIEIKYYFTAKEAIKAIKDDYKKLMNLNLKEYQKGLALTFTMDDMDKIEKHRNLPDKCKPFDGWGTLGQKGVQAIVACKDGIIEILFQ